MNGIREWFKGKKTYLTAIIGLLGAIVAWADGSVGVMGLLAAVWAAALAIFARAGISNSVTTALDKLFEDVDANEVNLDLPPASREVAGEATAPGDTQSVPSDPTPGG
jgi:hypothetical protein